MYFPMMQLRWDVCCIDRYLQLAFSSWGIPGNIFEVDVMIINPDWNGNADR